MLTSPSTLPTTAPLRSSMPTLLLHPHLYSPLICPRLHTFPAGCRDATLPRAALLLLLSARAPPRATSRQLLSACATARVAGVAPPRSFLAMAGAAAAREVSAAYSYAVEGRSGGGAHTTAASMLCIAV
eukprot:199702-Chlamydomonas_euryale.AAC.1